MPSLLNKYSYLHKYFHQNIKQLKKRFSIENTRMFLEHQIGMISEGSCDTFAIIEINYIKKL